MYDGQSRRADARMTLGFLCYADDKLLDILSGIAEHLIASGVGIEVSGPINRLYGPIRIPTPIFEAGDHS